MEKLLLQACLAGQEVDVVDQHDVHIAVFRAEIDGAAVLQRGDILVQQGLAGDVGHGHAGGFQHAGADRLNQMGLAEAGLSVDEERVVGASRRLGDGQRGRMGEAVGGPDHELVEGVLRIHDPDGLRFAGEVALRPLRAPRRPGRWHGQRRRIRTLDAELDLDGLLGIGELHRLPDQGKIVLRDPHLVKVVLDSQHQGVGLETYRLEDIDPTGIRVLVQDRLQLAARAVPECKSVHNSHHD